MQLKSTVLWSALATMIRLTSGFISLKVIALFVGTFGVALIGQFNNFNTVIMTIALGGIGTGVVTYTSQFKDDFGELQKIWKTAVKISFFLSIPTAIILLLLHEWLAEIFLHDKKYSSILLVLSASIFLYVANALLLSVLNGLHKIEKYNLINMLNSLLGLLITILLVYYYQIYGALFALVTNQSLTFFILVFFVRNEDWFLLKSFWGEIDKKYLKKLLGFSMMSLTTICTLPTSQMFVRSYLADHISWSIAGCWQGMQRISDSYLMIIYTALGTYFLPKLANLKYKEQIGDEIKNGYKFIMPFVLLFALMIFLFRDFIITLLFTKSFSPMRNMFLWQLIGDCFKVAGLFLAYLMQAKSKTRLFIFTEVLFGVSFVVFAFISINSFGANGAVVAFAFNYLFYFLFFVFLYRCGYLL